MTQKSQETVEDSKTLKYYPEGMFWYRKGNLGLGYNKVFC